MKKNNSLRKFLVRSIFLSFILYFNLSFSQNNTTNNSTKDDTTKKTFNNIIINANNIKINANTLDININDLTKVDTNNKPKYYFVTFTHFPEVDDDLPPSLIQFEFLFSWPINSKISGKNKRIIWCRNIILPSIQINNPQIRNSMVAPVYVDTNRKFVKYVNHIDLVQYSFFKTNIRFNIVTFYLPNFSNPQWKIQFDGLVNFYRSKVYNYNFYKIDTVSINSWAPGFNFRCSFEDKDKDKDKKTYNFSVDCFVSIFWLTPLTGIYKQMQTGRTSIPQPDVIYLNNDLIKYNIKNYNPIQSYGIQIKFKETLWLRMMLHNNYVTSRLEGKNYAYNSFFQIQLGLEKDIKELFEYFWGKNNKNSDDNKTNSSTSSNKINNNNNHNEKNKNEK